ncbi:acyl-CoA thioesterase [Basilea psittacipulmonis]|uniref:Thioesterase n=1 Tax=Basilea psittacipulmonis DSM 24701 TaxID=1072685 RepID=A0A077DGK2_9BURK|nr:acyl-CoA thioesterase [Basilea psittacipulmonis]AIL33266.1 thioesterase [Basilea psittacipulmonis DSM 24701]
MRKRSDIFTELEIKIPFFDVDSLHIVWHGNYIKYFEMARCQLLSLLNYDYNIMREKGYMWPVVGVEVKYIQPCLFDMDVVIRADLVEWESKLKVNYLVYDKKTGTRLTRGSTTQVAVSLETREMQFVTPESWQNAVKQYLEAKA